MCGFIKSRFCLLCFVVSCAVHLSYGGPTPEGTTVSTTTKYDSIKNSSSPTSDHIHKHYHELNSLEIDFASEQPKREQTFYLQKLFSEYGSNGVMNFEQFKVLLKNIGLEEISSHGHELHADHNKHSHDQDVDHKHHDDLDHDQSSVKHSDKQDGHYEHHEEEHASSTMNTTNVISSSSDEDHKYKRTTTKQWPETNSNKDHDNHTMCLEADELLTVYHFNQSLITQERFLQLCPAILMQLDRKVCPSHFHPAKAKTSSTYLKDIPPEVWGYSFASVLIISLVGLFGVAVIPIMQKVFYNHMLQFLVALAVGALSGDAMLHLIPHALQESHVSHDHSSHGDKSHDQTHANGVYKGLCGLAGIYFFFLMERLLTIVTDIKRKRKKRKTRAVVNGNGSGGEKCMKALNTHKDANCREKMMVIHPGNKALQSFAEEAHHEECMTLNKMSNNGDDDELDVSFSNDFEEKDTVLTHSHHHHSHSEGQNVPQTVAAIAWMVILGDGFHNFSDGLAIGTAFANSITGGFSTSIAVFCHELPHEIGDFAVLLRAGMKPKQAIIYNCISSILCFFGMVVGVTIGNIGEASFWIFIVVGGMFLYIALVDMLPEMTSVDTTQGEHPFCHLLFQVSGMVVGASIMLIIALYENDLKNVFET